MNKSLLFSIAFSLFAAPLSVTAATNDINESANLNNFKSSESQTIISGIFDDIKDVTESVQDTSENLGDAKENVGEINDGVGEIKSTVSGNDDSADSEVVEETVVQEGGKAPEVVDDSSGDSF